MLLWDEQVIFLGRAADTSLHASPAIKVCVALSGNFGLRTNKTDEWADHDSAIIAPGQPHAIDGRHHKMAMLLLVPEAKLAQPLGPIFSDKGITILTADVVAKIRQIFTDFDERLKNDNSIEDNCFPMIEAIAPGGEILPIDSRVSLSIEAIRSSREEGISVSEIAAMSSFPRAEFLIFLPKTSVFRFVVICSGSVCVTRCTSSHTAVR